VWQSERGVRGCTGTFTVGLLLTVFSCREKHNALIDKRLQINLDMTQSLKLAFKLCSFYYKINDKTVLAFLCCDRLLLPPEFKRSRGACELIISVSINYN